MPIGPTPGQTVASISQALLADEPFALLAVFEPGIESELAALVDRFGIPVVGSVSHTPPPAIRRSSNTFYVYGGTAELVETLGHFASRADASDARRRVIVGEETPMFASIAKRLTRDDAVELSLRYANGAFDPSSVAEAIDDEDDVVFFGRAADFDALIGALAARAVAPRLYLPAAAASPSWRRWC